MVATMLQRLRDFVGSLAEDDPAPASDEDRERLAVAALLVHAIAIDGKIDETERSALGRILAREYALSPSEIETLIEDAREAEAEAVDLYRFTSVLARRLDREGRLRVVRNLWEIVQADGVIHEFEDNLVWRVAELLGIERNDRIALKQSVAGAQG